MVSYSRLGAKRWAGDDGRNARARIRRIKKSRSKGSKIKGKTRWQENTEAQGEQEGRGTKGQEAKMAGTTKKHESKSRIGRWRTQVSGEEVRCIILLLLRVIFANVPRLQFFTLI